MSKQITDFIKITYRKIKKIEIMLSSQLYLKLSPYRTSVEDVLWRDKISAVENFQDCGEIPQAL